MISCSQISAFPKLSVVSILLFWTDGQEGVEFFQLPGDAWAGLLFISHIVAPNKVAVGAQDDALTDFFLDPIQAKPPIDCFTDGKRLVL